MTEIFFSVLVLFGVGALGVYMAENWRRPIGFTPDNLWIVNVDMRHDGRRHVHRVAGRRPCSACCWPSRELPRGRERGRRRCCRPYHMGVVEPRVQPATAARSSSASNEVTDEFKDVLGLRHRPGPLVRTRGRRRELRAGGDQRGDGARAVPGPGPDRARTSRPSASRARRLAGSPTGPNRRAARRRRGRGLPRRRRIRRAGVRKRSTASRSIDTDPSKRENRPPR